MTIKRVRDKPYMMWRMGRKIEQLRRRGVQIFVLMDKISYSLQLIISLVDVENVNIMLLGLIRDDECFVGWKKCILKGAIKISCQLRGNYLAKIAAFSIFFLDTKIKKDDNFPLRA